jgi:hypothetical protein
MVAERTPSPDRFERAMAAIHELIAERVTGRFATFDECPEGTPFPDGTEAMSGHVLTTDGQVFFFWTDWDADNHRPTFGIWRPAPRFRPTTPSTEYQQARRAVGL